MSGISGSVLSISICPKGSSGISGTSGGGSFVGIGNLVTPCCGSKSTISPIIKNNDIVFNCNECKKEILRKDFITIEQYTNKIRYEKLNDIL